MSANGSVGWSWVDTNLMPWDYRQILTHYYTKVKIGTADTNYRWVWLNVGSTPVHTGYSGERYFGSIPSAPTNMRINATYQVRMYIQNTGTAQWTFSSTTPYQLVYQWCDTNGANCGTATGAALGTINPGVATEVFVNVTTPAQTGTRMLKWDIKKPDGALFSTYQSQDWPTQKTTVTLRTLIGNTFTPWVASGSVTAGSQ